MERLQPTSSHNSLSHFKKLNRRNLFNMPRSEYSHRETKTDWFRGLNIYCKPWIWALWLTFGIYKFVGRNNNFTFNNHKTMVSFRHPGIFHGNSGVIDKILRVFVSKYFQLYIPWHSLYRLRTRKTGDLLTFVVSHY